MVWKQENASVQFKLWLPSPVTSSKSLRAALRLLYTILYSTEGHSEKFLLSLPDPASHSLWTDGGVASRLGSVITAPLFVPVFSQWQSEVNNTPRDHCRGQLSITDSTESICRCWQQLLMIIPKWGYDRSVRECLGPHCMEGLRRHQEFGEAYV